MRGLYLHTNTSSSKEIGGTCVKLVSGNTRIILDVGMPLVNHDGSEFNILDYDGISGNDLVDKQVLPPVDGLYRWLSSGADITTYLVFVSNNSR